MVHLRGLVLEAAVVGGELVQLGAQFAAHALAVLLLGAGALDLEDERRLFL